MKQIFNSCQLAFTYKFINTVIHLILLTSNSLTYVNVYEIVPISQFDRFVFSGGLFQLLKAMK